MSTTPVPDLSAQLAQHIADLGHKHASVSYLLVGALTIFMVICGVAGYIAVKQFDAQLARQDARDAQYQADRKVFMDSLTQHEALRAAEEAQIADLQAQIAKRDRTPLPKPIQDGLKPDATAKTVAEGLSVAYSDIPSFGVPEATPDGKVALSVPQAQQTLSSKADLDVTRADLKDTQAIVGLQKQSLDTLNSDLNQCKVLNTKAQADIEGYKKLAHRSKLQKFWGGAQKVLIFAGGAYLGHKF